MVLPAGRSTPLQRHQLRVSVIVPFGPQETEGAVLLNQLQALPLDCEVIAVRAGCQAVPVPTTGPTHGADFRVVLSPPGRARQMNVGAQAARGRWLWFLHADSGLGADALPALDALVARGHDTLGYFDLGFRDDGPWLARLNALGANLRSRWLGLPFGDQGLVLPAAWFVRLGGYDEQAAYGEDHLLVWRAHVAGLPVQRVGAALVTSARKYAVQGWWHTTRRHLVMTLRQAWPQWRALRRAKRGSAPQGSPGPTIR